MTRTMPYPDGDGFAGIEVLGVLNKSDLKVDSARAETGASGSGDGARLMAISAKTGAGIGDLVELLSV